MEMTGNPIIQIREETQKFARLAAGVAVFWLGVVWVATLGLSASVQWIFALWFICLLNLFLLGKVVAKVLLLMSDTADNTKTTERRRASPLLGLDLLLWGGLKFGGLGLLGFVLFAKAEQIPLASLLLGTTTYVSVPLLSGVFWSVLKSRASKAAQELAQSCDDGLRN